MEVPAIGMSAFSFQWFTFVIWRELPRTDTMEARTDNQDALRICFNGCRSGLLR